MTGLSRSAILAAPDLRVELVDVPEWGGQVAVRGLLAGEKDELEDWMVGAGREAHEYRARLLVYGCVDDQGARLFTAADVPELTQKSAVAVERVVAVIGRLSGLTKEEADAAGKASAALGGASSSASPQSSE